MPLIGIKDSGKHGVHKDRPAYELPVAAWSEARNIRFREGAARLMEGHAAVLGTPTVTPKWLLPVKTSTNSFWIYAGNTKVYAVEGVTHTNITRQSAGVDVDYAAPAEPPWNGGVLNGVPILNNSVDVPQMWLPVSAAQRLQNLSSWPATLRAKSVRPFKNFLVAMHLQKSAVDYPYLVKWSDAADPGTVPSSWNEADPTTISGESATLAETGDFIVDGHPLRDIFVIYKESSTWGMQFIGGQFIFRFYKMFDDFGMLTHECTREFKGRHFVVTRDDIVVHDGNQWESVGHQRYRRNLFSRIDGTNYHRTFVTADYNAKEMWICFPETGQSTCTRALIWNWESNTFTERELPGVNHVAFGNVRTSGEESWDTGADTWETGTDAWDTAGISAATETVLFAKESTAALLEGNNGYTFDGAPISAILERTGIPLVGQDKEGNPLVDPTVVKLCRGIYPKLQAAPGATFTVQLGGQMFQDGPVTWQPEQTFDPATQFKIDSLFSAKYLAIRWMSTGSQSWQLDSMQWDIERAGRY
jgi:hypothetical protein